MKATSTLGAAALALALAAAHAGSAAAEETKLTFNLAFPRTHGFVTGLFMPWNEAVEKGTNGRVKVEFTASSLAPLPRQFDMIAKGIADVAFQALAFQEPRIELPEMAEIPFSSPVDSAEINSVALWRTYKKFFEKADEFKGVKVLAVWTITGNQLFMVDKQVTKLSDIKGLKVRSLPGAAADFVAAMGATVVAAPAGKAYELLSKGVVDGTMMPPDSVVGFKLNDYVKHGTLYPGAIYRSTAAILMNPKTFGRLSKADQAVIEKASGEAYSRLTAAIDKQNAEALETLKKSGVQFVTADAQLVKDTEEKAKFLEHAWIERAKKKGVDGAAALAYYHEQIDLLRKAK
jgi:TRAP-type C4-dicarboxylate transport system substrate-binding protein